MKKEKKRQYSEFEKVTLKVYPSRILNLCGYGMKVIDYDMRWDDRLTKRGGGGGGILEKPFHLIFSKELFVRCLSDT